MKFDSLSFAIGKHGDSGPVRDVVSYLMGRVAGTAGEIWQTLTNVDVATFAAVSSVLRNLVIDITPVQSGSGDPAPDNVHPISGWSGVNIARTGNNLADMASTNIVIGKYIDNSGVEQSNVANFYNSSFIRVHANAKYIASFSAAVNYFSIMEYDINYNFIGRTLFGATGTPSLTNCTLTTSSNTAFIRFGSNMNGIEITLGDVLAINWMLNSGESALPYEPFGTTYHVSWQTEAGTVYGGTLRDNGNETWTLTVTMVAVDLSTFAWDAQPDENRWKRHTSLNSAVAPPNNNTVANIYSDTYKVVAQSSVMTTLNTIGMSSSKNVFVNNGNFTPGNEPTGIMVYELVSPVEYPTLAAESVRVLIGQNNIFADTGNINTITFRTH